MSTTIPTPMPSFTSTMGVTVMPSSSLPASATTGGSAGNLGAAVLSAAVLAALITAAINLWLARRKSREEERARIRNTLAEAFQAYASYKEFPYAVRCRRHDQAAEERIRLSEALREVQARLTYFEAWTKTENPYVGAAYAALIAELRRVAGGAIRQAWLDLPLHRRRRHEHPSRAGGPIRTQPAGERLPSGSNQAPHQLVEVVVMTRPCRARLEQRHRFRRRA